MTDGTTISSAAKEIEHQYGHLDILVNNAGITGSFRGAPSDVTVDQLPEVYDTNVFGVVAVPNAMLRLRRSQAGRYGSSWCTLTFASQPRSCSTRTFSACLT